jgi:hypothetical protein
MMVASPISEMIHHRNPFTWKRLGCICSAGFKIVLVFVLVFGCGREMPGKVGWETNQRGRILVELCMERWDEGMLLIFFAYVSKARLTWHFPGLSYITMHLDLSYQEC